MAINPLFPIDLALPSRSARQRPAPPPHHLTAPTRLLVVSDDAQLRTLLGQFLGAHRYGVDAVGSTAQLAQPAAGWDAAIVDAGGTQLEALRALRSLERTARVPTIAVAGAKTGVDSLWQRVDVVLDKPLEPRKLLLVLRGLLACQTRAAPPHQDALTAGPFTLQCLLNTLTVATREITLTGVETRILRELMLAATTPVARNRLAPPCNPARARPPDDRALDTHVKRLRRKLGTDEHGRTPIRTVRGVGYLLLTDWQPLG
jgi:DNA-binding response OmpR family regulator